MSQRNLLLGITGSIAAKKSIDLVNFLKENYNIKIIVTYEGSNYINDSDYDKYDLYRSWVKDRKISHHIELARWADEFIIYPATANFVSKVANGIADDLLTSTILMYKNRLKIFPAMHEEMLTNEFITNNLSNLLHVADIYGPRYGLLDVGDSGIGRLLEPIEVFELLTEVKDEKVFVISGPTREFIDDVRYITNGSSGKQGYALALESHSRGYKTNFITSITYKNLNQINQINFESSGDLIEIIKETNLNEGYLFMPAAISDFIPTRTNGKLDRRNGDLSINMSPNIDIIKNIKSENPKLIVVGFSAQLTSDPDLKKMNEKGIDYMVVNNISDSDTRFGSEENRITIIDKNNNRKNMSISSKFMIAKQILDHVIA